LKFKTRFKPLLLVSLCLMMLLSSSAIYADKNPILDQTTRLSALAKVWGLLKYYHPNLASGEIDWDAALIDAIPKAKAAQDYESFNMEINALIQEAGDVSNDFNAGVPAHPNEALFKWLKDKEIFSSAVRKKLQTLQKKHVPTLNHYVYYDQWNVNIKFDNEKEYNETHYPDETIRLLGLFRFWNIIHYFSPYKEEMDKDWDDVLEEYIPVMIEVKDHWEYGFAMSLFTNNLNDSHAFLYGAALNYKMGYYFAPFELSYVDGATIVTRVFKEKLNSPDDVQVGDIVTRCRGMAIDDFRAEWRKYTHGSNEPTTDRNLNMYVLRGQSDQLEFTFNRNGQTVNVITPGYYGRDYYGARDAEDAKLDKYKILDNNIGYVNMGIAVYGDVAEIMTALMNTQAIIFDMRNYPNATIYAFTDYLIPTPTNFVKFAQNNLDFPGEFYWEDDYTSTWEDNPDYYKGRVIILVNEITQSQAEFTTMAFQTAPDATVIGSQTAGADGNIAYVSLPAYQTAYFTGLGVYYPDGSKTQRIGIVPDIEIRHTVAGIKNGVDEVLDRAIHFIENND
jgi:carboxyl-terminal processing protease